MNLPLPDLLRFGADEARAGRRVLACLVVGARGSTPQSAGALMLVDESAGIHGTIGGGCVEAEVRRRAFEMLGAGETGVVRFKLDHDYGWDDGLICGGTLELAIAPLPGAEALERAVEALDEGRPAAVTLEVRTGEGPARCTMRIPPRDRLYIAGAGHVGRSVARLGLDLEFDVTVFDDRHDLLEHGLPAGAATRPGDIARELAAAPVDGRTFCLIVTRGHRHDEQALAAVADRGAGYVGMIGSRRKVKLIFDDLAAQGVSPEALERVHAPVGLDIGAITVDEIAVAIAAQLVQARRAERGPLSVEGPEPIGSGAAPGAGGAERP